METMKMGRETEGTHRMGGKKELEHMRITPSENGGHTVRHEFKSRVTHSRTNGMGREYQEPEEHVFGEGDHAEMMSHIGKHLGIKGSWKGGGSGEKYDRKGEGAEEQRENEDI